MPIPATSIVRRTSRAGSSASSPSRRRRGEAAPGAASTRDETSKYEGDLAALAERPLGGQADDDSLARVLARAKGTALGERRHHLTGLLRQFDQLSGRGDWDRLRSAASAAIEAQLERGVPSTVQRARPPRSDRAVRPRHVQELVILEAGERLRDHRVAPPGEAENSGEVVSHTGGAGSGAAECENRHGIAYPLEVPHGEVEEVHRLLEDPRPDTRRIVAPPARARPEREPK